MGGSPRTAVKSVRGKYYLNGHWTIEVAGALPVANTILHYERGAEGDVAPERLHARGPTSEPLVIEVSWLMGEASDVKGAPGPQEDVGCLGPEASRRAAGSGVAEAPLATGLIEDPPVQLISQEPSPGVRYEYHLPLSVPEPGFSWSHGSWSECSAECGGGEVLAPGTGQSSP